MTLPTMTLPLFAANPLLAAVAAPPIPAAQAWKTDYAGGLGPMIDLSQAVPGTPPPEAFLERLGAAAATADATRYGSILGDMVLREAHAAETARLYGGAVTAQNVVITAGCNMAFVIAMMALAKAGDAIILPSPWYFNHKMTLDMLGIETRVLPCRAENGFVPVPADIAGLIDERVRALVLISPNNPTGAVYPPEVLAAARDLCRKRRIALVLDETYRDFLPEGQARSHALFTDPDWADTLIQLYSFSKAHAIPGHRLGAMIAAPAFLTEVAKVLDSVQICPARPAQPVVSWAIAALADWREEQRAELARRAGVCRAIFDAAPGWRIDSIGAYFAFVAHPFTGKSSSAAAEILCATGGVLGLPGSYFGPGLESHLRIAFANVGSEALQAVPARLATLRV